MTDNTHQKEHNHSHLDTNANMTSSDNTKDVLSQSSQLPTDKTMKPDIHDDKKDQTDLQDTSLDYLNNPTDDDSQKAKISSIGDSIKTLLKTSFTLSGKRNSNSDSQPKEDSKIDRSKQSAPPRRQSDHVLADIKWLNLQYHENDSIKKPAELENDMNEPSDPIDKDILDRVQGAMIGMALGDALGAHVEFRPRQYLVQHPVTKLESGGTWGLSKGQFTDDTSMALCLANSLIANRGYNPYDQLVRYKWWYKHGYMSSTGQCFDIGAATRQSVHEFEQRQKQYAKSHNIPPTQIDYLPYSELKKEFDVYCSEEEVAGNGALMRLAPVPLFFYRGPKKAVEYSGRSGQITHGDQKAYDACRYYGALIVAALKGYSKEELLDDEFYSKNKKWFGKNELHPDIKKISEGSYKRKNGYDDGIRGKGYIVSALEAALWAFWSDENSFKTGALAAVNLGDDSDTTAAIYGQLAGAYYGYKQLPSDWVKDVYAKTFIEKLSKWIVYEGGQYQTKVLYPSTDQVSAQIQSDNTIVELSLENLNPALPVPSTDQVSPQIQSDNTIVELSLENLNPALPVPSTDQVSPQIQSDNTIVELSLEKQNLTVPVSSTEQSEFTIALDKEQHTNVVNTSVSGKTSPDMEPPSLVPNAIHIPSVVSTPKMLDSDRCLEWTCEDVCQWVKSFGDTDTSYVDGFKRHNVDGRHLLTVVDNEDLHEFGIDSKYRRKVIRQRIRELRKRCKSLQPSNTTITNKDFYNQFDGDYILPFQLTETTYPNTMSCTLQPQKVKIHSKLYARILEWLGPLPKNCDIDKIELIHRSDFQRMFLHRINVTEDKQKEGSFEPNLDVETNPSERKKVLDRLDMLTKQVSHNQSDRIVRVWHGCRRKIALKILSTGFAALSRLDAGWFGTGIYFSSSAEYATKYATAEGCLIMCYVILLNPFPVIADDAPPNVGPSKFRFYGKGNYSNYQCHYIPVASAGPGTSMDFRPPPSGVQDAPYDELVVSQQDDILPQVVVHLKPSPMSSAASNSC